MNPTTTPPDFLCLVDDKVQGPFDLIELAGLLKESAITGATLVRRTGDENWRPFQELPEFTSAGNTSIEEIARHLETKSNVQPDRNSKQRSDPLVWFLGGIATCLIAFAALWVLLAPARNSNAIQSAPELVADDSWPLTEGAHFSIRCPYSLPRQMPKQRDDPDETYKTEVNGEIYGVSSIALDPHFTPATVTEIFNRIRASFVDDFHQHITSDRVVMVNGYNGREIFFSGTIYASAMPDIGGIRLITTPQSLIFAWAYLKPKPDRPDNLKRFLSSLVLR